MNGTRSLVILMVLAFCTGGMSAFGSAPQAYVTSTGGAVGNCPAGSTTFTPAQFNTSSNWGSGSSQIGPGTVVLVCGTITVSGGATGLTFQGSGSSENPITLLFDTDAVLQAPYWSGGGANVGGAIVMNGVSNITVDGGTNGLVRATLNGTPGGACPGGTCSSPAHDGNGIMFLNCTNCTLKNLEVGPIYLRTSWTDESSASSVGCRVISKEGTCTNCSLDNNKLHGASAVIFWNLASGTDTAPSFTNNEIYDASAGLIFAQGRGSTGVVSGGVTFSGNSLHDFYTWNDHDTYNFHHDGIHIWSYTTALTGFNIYDNHFYGDWGSGTALIYYEQYGSGTGSINIFNNLFNFKAVPDPALGAGSFHALEFQGNATTVKIYNNTIYGVTDARSIASGIYMNSTAAAPDLRNNIIGGTLSNMLEGSAIATTSNNNVYDFSGGSILSLNGGGYAAGDFTAWKAACSCDSSSSNVAPNLDLNYKIQDRSSSAYQHGQNLTGNPNSYINSDFAGQSRPESGSWDTGAFQYNYLSAPINLKVVPQ
jgi:hypothetical protein